MEFPRPLVSARFVRREKRFLVHARLQDGRPVVAHTNNTGRMSGCLAPGCAIWLSPADNPRRKLAWTLEMVETVPDPAAGQAGGVLAGVNTALANRLVAEAIGSGRLPQLSAYGAIRPEVPYGTRSSRADFLLTGHPDGPAARCWVEVKNVTLVRNGCALFPDAPSERGRKHLQELMDVVALGDRACLVFCIQRGDARSVGPADDIDPEYGRLLRRAAAAGVAVLGAGCRVGTRGIEIMTPIPLGVL